MEYIDITLLSEEEQIALAEAILSGIFPEIDEYEVDDVDEG